MIENFTLFGKEFSLYQILAVAGLLAMGFYACRRAKRRGMDDNDMILFLLAAAVGAVLGGHLLYALTQTALWPRLGASASWRELLGNIYLVFGGSVFYGGLLGGTAVGAAYLRIRHMPLGAYGDIMAAAVPLFHVFGRLGCFLSGCCYGVACEFGVTYHHALVPQANDVSRFPVQLLEALMNLGLFLVLRRLERRGKLPGRLFGVYLMSYAVGRFLLEFLRGDGYRGFLWGLSTSQWVSVLVFPCALAAVLILSRRRRYGAA